MKNDYLADYYIDEIQWHFTCPKCEDINERWSEFEPARGQKETCDHCDTKVLLS